MATVSKKPPATAPAPGSGAAKPRESLAFRAVDAVYRFLASLKLAVILLTTLASVLAYATFYESYEGTPAVQEHVYRSKGFALLMAMLGVNILCAALIRFPWKRRQLGFVVTHAGLLTVLVGSFISIKTTDDGLVRLAEGASTGTYIRDDHGVLRLEKLDPQTGKALNRYLLDLSPGAQPWEAERREAEAKDSKYRLGVLSLRLALALLAVALLAGEIALAWRHSAWFGRPFGAALATLATLTAAGLGSYAWNRTTGPRRDVLSDASDPFKLAMIDFLPASSPLQPEYKPASDGVPMLRVALLTQPPGADRASDAFKGRGWIPSAGDGLGHGTQAGGPARIGFQYLDGPRAAEALADFLDPPADPLKTRRARFHYRDSKGQPRVYDWVVEDDQRVQIEDGKVVRPGKSVKLPDSDLTASLVGVLPMPPTDPSALEGLGSRMVHLLSEMGRATRSAEVQAAVFRVRKEEGEEVAHIGWAGLPLAPTVTPFGKAETLPEELVWIDFYYPPAMGGADGSMRGTFGAIDVAVTKDGRFFYRAFGRDGLRGKPGPIRRGEAVQVFGGGKMPMQVSIRVDEFLPSGKAEMVCKPVEIPKNEMERAIEAAKLSMTADGETREFWIRRSRYEPLYEDIQLGDQLWRVSYDSDTRPLPFDVNLVDFDPSNDPGASARAAYRSDVFLNENGGGPMPRRAFADLPTDGYFYFLDRPTETFRKVGDSAYAPFDGGNPITPDDRQVVVQPIPMPSKITMNRPLSREHWTFYQTEYEPILDEHRELTGSFRSILSVRHDPAWSVVYGGCLLVVAGTFLQFYMRAGVFTDGGKKERQKAEARARRASGEPEASGREPAEELVEDL